MTETTPTDLIDPREDLVRPGELSIDGSLSPERARHRAKTPPNKSLERKRGQRNPRAARGLWRPVPGGTGDLIGSNQVLLRMGLLSTIGNA
jgi:hypothetical protein